MGLTFAEQAAQGNRRALLALDGFHLAVANRDANALCRADTGICSISACFQALVDETGEQISRWCLEFSHVG